MPLVGARVRPLFHQKRDATPPFGAQVILNGHEWVACQAQTAGTGFTKEGNCFTAVTDPQALAQVAGTIH